ncbi:MAG: 5-(carboxyamino)imidazole ribonucleotide synthase [Rhodospirillaceae bacterium]|nr:5-(carboxyamino)imidazole ribonucleotide synthase [Rhodospirillaceae bacterium]
MPPGSTIGILGGGQLGRMTAMAAARLGYRTHILCPERDCPAAQVASAHTAAAYDDRAALDAFAAAVDVVSFEFENIPSATAEHLAALKPTRPRPQVLYICQQRLREKDFLNAIAVPTTRYRAVPDPGALPAAVAAIGRPCVLKSAAFGYDGKGQVAIDDGTDLEEAWRRMGGALAILEARVDFVLELSVIVARGLDGATAAYAPGENRHRHHILDTTIVPAPVDAAAAARAQALACRIAEAIGLVGLMGVEMFLTRSGEILVNELAPRPHNSGHWTIDGAVTSQFEQFVRAICGLPLGSPERHSDAVMRNLIGEAAQDWLAILADPGAKLHLYGKTEMRPGRKMGHVTRLAPRSR